MPSPKIWELAERLVSCEAAAGDTHFGSNSPKEFWVVDQLRGPLSRFVGVCGFRALLVRALALTKAGVPELNGVQVRADGSLEGFTNSGIGTESAEAGGMLVAQLLGLLAVIVGEGMTLRLLDTREGFPAVSLEPREKDSAEELIIPLRASTNMWSAAGTGESMNVVSGVATGEHLIGVGQCV